MTRIIDIGLYRSLEKPPAQMRATSMRKIYTSLLIVLLIITGGIALFFYYSSQQQENAISETPVKSIIKPITLSEKIAEKIIEWDTFTNAILPLNPTKVISDGEINFITVFETLSSAQSESLIANVAKIGRVIRVIDTSNVNGKSNIILRGRIVKAHTKFQPQPVKKIMRTTVMNMVDSLAQTQGLKNINREVVAANEKVKDGKRFRYRMTMNGSYQQFMAFARKIKELKYAIAPFSYVIAKDTTQAIFDIVWGLYDYNPPQIDSTKVATKKKK